MFNTPALATAYAGIVGWHPAEGNPDGELKLAPALLESRSGLYVNDLSELLGLDVLVHVVPTGETLSKYLGRLQADALRRFVIRLGQEQELTGKVLVPATQMLNTPGRRGAVVNKEGRFVGFQFTLPRRRGVAFTLPSLTLQLDAVQTTPLPIYIYSDAQPEPVHTFTMSAGENKPYFPFVVPLEGVDISFAGEGATCYVGYYEDDLTGYAIPRDYTCGPCYCDNDPFSTWGGSVTPRPFSVAAGRLDAERNLFDTTPGTLGYVGQNFGLNFTFLSYCDVAAALKSADNQNKVAEAAQLAVGIRLLESLISSPKITQLTARPDVQADGLALLYTWQARLYGGKEHGTDNYYPSMLKKLVLDLSELDSLCQTLPASPLSVGDLRR
jgi:hypothetical protein